MYAKVQFTDETNHEFDYAEFEKLCARSPVTHVHNRIIPPSLIVTIAGHITQKIFTVVFSNFCIIM